MFRTLQSRRVLRLKWLAVVFASAMLVRQPALGTAARLDLSGITPAGRIHNLTVEEAAHAHPVIVRGVATYYDPYIDQRHAALFVCDSSGCIFAALSATNASSPHRGDLVEVQGVTSGGDYAPMIAEAKVRVLGMAAA
ncbi:MAG: hypothetical protein ABI693_35335, partial [Bryobacteraceae bacterium]